MLRYPKMLKIKNRRSNKTNLQDAVVGDTKNYNQIEVLESKALL